MKQSKSQQRCCSGEAKKPSSNKAFCFKFFLVGLLIFTGFSVYAADLCQVESSRTGGPPYKARCTVGEDSIPYSKKLPMIDVIKELVDKGYKIKTGNPQWGVILLRQ